MDFSIITWDIFLYLLKGAGMSLLIAVISVTAGTILGTLGAIARLSHNKVANIIAAIYVEVLRGTPMLMQITFAFLALPAIIRMIIGHPIRFDPLVTGIVAIGLNSGAYTTELIRSGINGVDHGEFITLIKDSSLLSTIGVVELMKSATTVGANYYAYLPPLTVASGIYLVLNLIISTVSRILERRLAVSD